MFLQQTDKQDEHCNFALSSLSKTLPTAVCGSHCKIKLARKLTLQSPRSNPMTSSTSVVSA
eukprot:1160695-Pelagomonas_calceolata.AAC.3